MYNTSFLEDFLKMLLQVFLMILFFVGFVIIIGGLIFLPAITLNYFGAPELVGVITSFLVFICVITAFATWAKRSNGF